MMLIILIIVVLLVAGGGGGYYLGNPGYDYRYGGGGIGLVLLVVLILFLLGAMSIRVALLVFSPAHQRGAPRHSVERADGARGRAEEPPDHGPGAHGD